MAATRRHVGSILLQQAYSGQRFCVCLFLIVGFSVTAGPSESTLVAASQFRGGCSCHIFIIIIIKTKLEETTGSETLYFVFHLPPIDFIAKKCLRSQNSIAKQCYFVSKNSFLQGCKQRFLSVSEILILYIYFTSELSRDDLSPPFFFVSFSSGCKQTEVLRNTHRPREAMQAHILCSRF